MIWVFPQLAFCILQRRRNSQELTATQLLGDKAVRGWFFASFGSIVAVTQGTKQPGQHAEAQGIPHICSLPTCFVTIDCSYCVQPESTSGFTWLSKQTTEARAAGFWLFTFCAPISSPSPCLMTNFTLLSTQQKSHSLILFFSFFFFLKYGLGTTGMTMIKKWD